ncbi:TPT-domain-containing protein [Yamadazyma tenuis ATCC 10573]|uniref:TPT-domain-containing protein n=2 Tax=Candida tenuis TaxID=2315449 RepID=G3BCT8_CANTC|nr:TPT-domain-containing protein [Yamadazyma tenuis ATCC 10573]EGV60207.1 TPT-domain-containing protein [Yamadazyma tenuis ATCC 10573]
MNITNEGHSGNASVLRAPSDDDNESVGFLASNSGHRRLPKHLHNKNTSQTIVYILGWYIFSLSISIYNKWMFGPGLNFRFPIIITSFHQFCLFLLSCLVLYVNPSLRPKLQSSETLSHSPFSRLFSIPALLYLKQIVPCSLASAGDIGISNLSIMFVSLSLYTMLKTSSLMFVLLFGLLFRLEKFHWRLLAIVSVMTCSVVLMVKRPNNVGQNDEENSPTGIILVLLASIMSGLRWSFTQLLLRNNPHTPNSIVTIFYLSPSMCLVLLVIGLVVEGWSNFLASEIWELKGVLTTIGLLVVPGILAFMMTLCEFKLLQVSQVITLSVAGIFKELMTICLSSIIFGDRLSVVNVVGLVITFLDILWYNWFRYSQNKYAPLKEIEMRKL